MTLLRFAFIVVLAAALNGVPALAQAPAATSRLVVTVVDQTGGVLPAANVTVSGDEEITRAVAVDPLTANNLGVAVVESLRPGRYSIKAEFPGLETVTVRNVRVRGAETRQRMTLPIERGNETVTVGRDARSSALDPKGDAFSTILTRDQIDALPDDPEELEAVLKAMSPPGAQIRVDGFAGGQLPSKSQIRSIRLPRFDSFAAQNHGGIMGAFFIDIMTTPGTGAFRASTDFTLRDDALNAQNPFSPTKGNEHLNRYGFSAGGAIVPQKSGYSIGGMFADQLDTDNIRAALPGGGTASQTFERPTENRSLNARFDQSLSPTHAMFLNLQHNSFDRANLGVGGYNLPERAYSSSTSDTVFRFSENGPIGRRFFSETKAQVIWQQQETVSAFEKPTVRVLDAFTAGGAQQRGGRKATLFEFSSDLDYVRGNHSMRTGFLLEGGRYRSDQFTNYFGTYTFSSLEDYEAGVPRTFTQRVGDPVIEYSNAQFSMYAQDDWRASRSLLMSYGLRYEVQTHTGEAFNLSPRFSAAWSPYRAGHTTVRASAGYFYDWLDMGIYDQTLRVNGFRQRELQIQNPSFPDPGTDGTIPPGNRYLLDPDRPMASSLGITTGAERRFSGLGSVSAAYTWRNGSHVLSGFNLNAPVDGVRPDDRFANIVEARGDAASRRHSVDVGGTLTLLNYRQTLFSANYGWSKGRTNTTGAFSPPASADLDTEWGQDEPTHRFSTSLSMRPTSRLSMSFSTSRQSGRPYNVTTGFDDNGDGLFNDRPSGLGRNTARTAAQWSMNARVSYGLGFGTRPPVSTPGATTTMMGGDSFGGGASSNRYRVDLYVSATNLTNHNNYTGYSGVMTSPFFGQPTNVMNPRRIEVGVRFGI